MSSAPMASQTDVLILAAGRGARMRGLTENTPKPLIKLGKKSLIEYHLERLARLGFSRVVINIAYLAEQIPAALGDGSRYGVHIQYSDESSSGALETAGGIAKALPLINSPQFLVVNSDIFTDFDYRQLLKTPDHPAQLVLVPNPPHNAQGDFRLNSQGIVTPKIDADPSYTFSGIARYTKSLFQDLPVKKQALAPIFNKLISQSQLHGQIYQGLWRDIGTPERLHDMEQELAITTWPEKTPTPDS
jgi:MurNAc alpha-1-phosphate uridylyltransferase